MRQLFMKIDMTCKICLWLRRVFRVDYDADCDAVWASIWDETQDWERLHSNDSETFAIESDDNRDRIAIADMKGETDAEGAFQSYLALAEAGSVWCMEMVAWHYRTGTGVSTDFEQAQQFYRRAISGGSWMATLGYARLLEAHGYHETWEEVLEDGVRSNFIPACFWLAWLRYRRSPDRATCREIRPLLEHAAKEGHPAAKIILGRLMAKGKFGFREIPAGLRLLWDMFPRARSDHEVERTANLQPKADYAEARH